MNFPPITVVIPEDEQEAFLCAANYLLDKDPGIHPKSAGRGQALEAMRTRIGMARMDADKFGPHPAPIPMRLTCPECKALHIDEGEFATKPHHTHSCQHCGLTWRPAVVATVGVRFLPGFKNDPPK